MPQVLTKDDAQTAADLAADAKAAQAAAEAGFASVDEPETKAEKPAPKVEKVQEKSEADKAAESKVAEEAAAKAAAEAEWDGVPVKVRQTLESISGKVGALDKLQHDFKSLAGRTGAALEGVNALKAALEAAKTVEKAGGDVPSKEQIVTAAASDEQWGKLKEMFTDWSDEFDPTDVIDKRIAEHLAAQTGEIIAKATSQAKAEARELAKVDRKYETWATDIFVNGENDKDGFTKDFAEWHVSQPQDVQELEHSTKAADAIKVLDAYYAHKNAVAEATAKQERNKKRLDSAITPKGVAQPATRTLTEEEAMMKGFLSVDT